MSHVLSIFAFVLAAVLPVAAAAQTASPADEPIGYVAAVEGSAVIQRAAAELPAAVGTVVNDEDRLLTHAASRLLVVLDSGSRIVVGPNTAVALQVLIAPPDTDDRIVRILEGILRISIGDGDEGVRTVSPTAIAAARSTEWIMEYADDSTAVLALEGLVAVTGQAAGETVLLEPGFGTDVPAGGPPSEPRVWGEARADDARRRTTLGAP